jgi:amino acid permease
MDDVAGSSAYTGNAGNLLPRSQSTASIADSATSRNAFAHGGRASRASTVANTLCTMVGGGILAIPLAFEHSSLGVGVALVLIAIAINILTVYMLTSSCDRERTFTLRRLLENAFPNVAQGTIGRAVEAFIVVSNTSALIVYVKIIGTSAPPVVNALAGRTGFWSHEELWIAATAIVGVPAACAKELRELFVFSVLGFLALFYICGVIVVRFFDGTYAATGSSLIAPDETYFRVDSGILPGFSIILGALMYQMNVPVQYHELRDRTPRRMVSTAAVTYCIVAVEYIATGLLGCLTFGSAQITGNKSEGNILKLYREDDTAMNVGRAALCFHILCAFPIYAVVARRSLHVAIFGEPTVVLRDRVVEAVGLVAVVVVVAMFVPGIGVVVQFTGALFGTTIAVTIPALIYFRLFGDLNVVSATAKMGDTTETNNSDAARLYVGVEEHIATAEHQQDVKEESRRVRMWRWWCGLSVLVRVSAVLCVLGTAETLFSVVVTIVSLC